MISKKEIIDYFEDLCNLAGKKLSREEYRKLNPTYTSSLIEKIWGNWTNFTNEVEDIILVTRQQITKTFPKSVNKIVISYVNDGSEINFDFFETLKKYCEHNHAELGILWGKNIKKNKTFNTELFKLLQPYLATRFEFAKDTTCIAQDFLIPTTQKNPLLNLDKLSTNLKTIIVGASKQYIQILPYKQYTSYRVACSTGTLSENEYKETISNQIDAKYHTFGAIYLEWNENAQRYIVRDLSYKNNSLQDLNKIYTKDGVETIDSLPAMVLGDLHLPDNDSEIIKKTLSFINKYKPQYTMLHDVASWNTVCHHNFGKCLTLTKFGNVTLYNELHYVISVLKDIAKNANTTFKIVNSNHDAFIEKWLEDGEFVKDKQNAIIGAELFIKYSQGKNILDGYLPKNVEFLNKNESFEICGYELSEHGDCGISGASGSANAYNKTFENCIVGHTHSPRKIENTVYVGTLSKLILDYNQKGMTNWANCNAIIHENGTSQLIFV